MRAFAHRNSSSTLADEFRRDLLALRLIGSGVREKVMSFGADRSRSDSSHLGLGEVGDAVLNFAEECLALGQCGGIDGVQSEPCRARTPMAGRS